MIAMLQLACIVHRWLQARGPDAEEAGMPRMQVVLVVIVSILKICCVTRAHVIINFEFRSKRPKSKPPQDRCQPNAG